MKARRSRATDRDRRVGARVRERRRELGISMEELAARIGVAYQQLQKYETGVNRITAGRLSECAEALNTPITYFFEGTLPSKFLAAASRKKSRGIKDVAELQPEHGD